LENPDLPGAFLGCGLLPDTSAILQAEIHVYPAKLQRTAAVRQAQS
jgi:hypothetical protein